MYLKHKGTNLNVWSWPSPGSTTDVSPTEIVALLDAKMHKYEIKPK